MHSSNIIASSPPSRHPGPPSLPDGSSALSPAIPSTGDSETEPESDFIDDDMTEPETQYSELIPPPPASKSSPKINELLRHALRGLSNEHSPCSVHGVHAAGNCTAELRQVLDIWKKALRDPSSAPPRIAYRLDRRDPKERTSLPYTTEELVTLTLDTEHATVLRHLQSAATLLGFELYLSNAKLEIVGSGNAYDPHVPLDDIEMLPWPKPKVALNFSPWFKVGQGPVEVPFFELEDDQWIPNPPPDDDSFLKKEYDWALRPAPGELREWYIVTVIMIQSRMVGGDFHMSEVSSVLASATLRESKSLAPTSQEEVLWFQLVNWCKMNLQDPKAVGEPLHALSVSCIQWKDFNRWDNLMRQCNVQKNIRLLPFNIFLEACKEFGFPRMKSFLQDTMVHDNGNEARYGLLRHLAPAVPREFCRESITTILHHLSRPSEEDADFFSEVAREDGAEYFQREVVLRLEKFSPSLKFWSTLASKLRRLTVSSDQMARLAESITGKVLRCFEPFPARCSSNPDVSSWIDALKICIELEDHQRVVAIIRQIVKATGLRSDKAYVANYYLVPSVAAMERMLKLTGHQPSDQMFAPYWAMAIHVITYELLLEGQFTDPNDGVKALTKAIQFSRDPGPLRHLSSHETKHFDIEEKVKILSKKQPQIVESLARGLSELSMADFNEEEAQDHDRLVRQLVRLYVQECNLPHLVSIANVPTYRADLDSNVAEEAPALHLIKLCYEIVGGDQRAIRAVLNRASEIPAKIDADYLFGQLSPFIRSLRSYLEKQTPPQDLSVHPYFGFINRAIPALEDFLRRKPVRYEEIQTFIGSCSPSTFLEFVNDPDKEVLHLSRADKHRAQQELQRMFSRRWLRWTKDTAVKKDKLLMQANQWNRSMEKAKALWRGIGPKDVLRKIIGDKFSEMEALFPEKLSHSPRDPSELRTHPNSSFRPTTVIMRGDAEASTATASTSSSRPMKRTLSGDTAQAPHKKQRSEEKVMEITDVYVSPRFP